MKGLTFYKLVSPYKEDVTKNCGLTGQEVDANFIHLKDEVIKNAYWENGVLVLQKYNDEILTVSGITEGMAKDLDIKYDSTNGSLIVTNDGQETIITGFTTPSDFNATIYSDETLEGKGTPSCPLSISPLQKTGQYSPAIKLIDTTKNEKLPNPKTLAVGDRYVTVESISDFGYLYDFNSVSKISSDLRDAASPWRVPTKEDWDNMLNAIEPRLEDRNHDKVTSNKQLGRFAGKFLKTYNYWKLENNSTSGCTNPDCICGDDCTCTNCGNLNNTLCSGNNYSNAINYEIGCEGKDPYCAPTCGEYLPGTTCPPANPYPNRGIDKYGFGAVPAGYGDDGCVIEYFGERGWYWTASNSQCLNAYAKRFEYDKSTVYQEIISANYLLSLRLVKDYDGSNYNERESILGCDYSTVLMPSTTGKTIWTSTNIAFTNRYYNPVAPNNGIGLTYTKKYFMNEWDGCRWKKNELKEGDSIVFLKAPNGENNIEYRVIGGSLNNVAEAIYDDVIATVRPELDNIKGMITNEINRAKEAEEKLQQNIDSETARAVYAEKELQQNIDNEEAARIQADTVLNEKIVAETDRATEAETKLQENIDTVQAGLDAEINRATEAEKKNASDIATVNSNLVTAIDNINKNVYNGFTEINKAILAEVEARKAQDDVLNTKIDTETTRATEAEKALSDRIDAINTDNTAQFDEIKQLIDIEEEARIAADNELQENIDEANESISMESERAKGAEKQLQDNINAESLRAQAAEKKNAEDIATVNTNLVTAIDAINQNVADGFNTINGGIATEIEERKAADAKLDEKIQTLKGEQDEALNNVKEELQSNIDAVDNKLDEEIKRSTEQDQLITERLFTPDGHTFSPTEGEMVLKAVNPDNDIHVKLVFDFGTF